MPLIASYRYQKKVSKTLVSLGELLEVTTEKNSRKKLNFAIEMFSWEFYR